MSLKMSSNLDIHMDYIHGFHAVHKASFLALPICGIPFRLFIDNYNLQNYKCNINRHILMSWHPSIFYPFLITLIHSYLSLHETACETSRTRALSGEKYLKNEMGKKVLLDMHDDFRLSFHEFLCSLKLAHFPTRSNKLGFECFGKFENEVKFMN